MSVPRAAAIVAATGDASKRRPGDQGRCGSVVGSSAEGGVTCIKVWRARGCHKGGMATGWARDASDSVTRSGDGVARNRRSVQRGMRGRSGASARRRCAGASHPPPDACVSPSRAKANERAARDDASPRFPEDTSGRKISAPSAANLTSRNSFAAGDLSRSDTCCRLARMVSNLLQARCVCPNISSV